MAYMNGIRTTFDQIFHDNMTTEEIYEASRYTFTLEDSTTSPIYIDIPESFRSIVNYRTTLGHKVNHKFNEEANGEFVVINHPLFGLIAAIRAMELIEEDYEIFVDYNYYKNDSPIEKLLDCPLWYRNAYTKYQKRNK